MGRADAVLFHAYPGGTGGTAIAESILGKHNRFGRLTMSWLPKSFESRVRFGDYSFAQLGRSYRYYTPAQGGAAALFRFGDGMSFSDHSLAVTPPPSQCELVYGVTVTTTAGPRGGDVVVLAYIVPKQVKGLPDGTPIPLRQLVAARRARTDAQGGAKLVIALDTEALQLTGLDGVRSVRDGLYTVVFSTGSAPASPDVEVPLQLTEYASGC